MTAAQDKRRQAELQIIQELKQVPSCREMQRLLKEKFGIVANHNTINDDLKQDLESLTQDEYENQKSGILDMLNKEIEIAHNIATNKGDSTLKLKAMNTVSKLSKTKADILIKFRHANAQLTKEEKPEINIIIGEPKQIDEEKFKKLNGVVQNEDTEMDT